MRGQRHGSEVLWVKYTDMRGQRHGSEVLLVKYTDMRGQRHGYEVLWVKILIWCRIVNNPHYLSSSLRTLLNPLINSDDIFSGGTITFPILNLFILISYYALKLDRTARAY